MALSLAVAWLLPAALRSFALGPARSGPGRCPSLRAPSSAAGSSPPNPSLSLACSATAAEEQRPLRALPLVVLASLAAAVAAATRQRGRGRRGTARVVRRAAESEEKAAAAKSEEEDQTLADQLEDKLAFLREREEMLISRIAAVQDKIETIESAEEPVAEADEATAEKEEAEEDDDAEALKAAEALAKEAEKMAEAADEAAGVEAPTSYSSPEEETYQELKILEGLADTHEDVTKKEIEALEALAGGKKKRGFSLREAGARLREKVDKEFKAMREREAKLLANIQDTKTKIEEVEKAPDADSKAVLELRMLESLASAYEDTTAEEIKALQKLADEGGK